MADIDRIKENINTMIEKGAPKAHIDAYIASEGITLKDLNPTAPVAPQAAAQPTGQAPEWAGRHPNLYGVAGAAREVLGPVVEALGLAGGAVLGTGSGGPVGGVAGAGLGYAGVRQGLSAADVALGNKPDPGLAKAAVQGASDVGAGATMEAGGQVFSAGTQRGLQYLKSKSLQLYESALKQLTTLKPGERSARVNTALNEGLSVSKSGLEKSKATVKEINNQITERIKDLEGTTVSREASLKPVEDLYKKIPEKNITPQREQGIVAQYIKEVQESNPNPDIPIQQAQVFKQTLHKELNDYYANLARGKVSPEPVMAQTKAAMANGLRQEITKAFPEIQNLNAREASLIQLNKSLERAVNRISNREIIPLAVQIASGRPGGVLKTLMVKAIDHPQLKTSLAIALHRASPEGLAQTGKMAMQSIAIGANQRRPLESYERQ